MKTARYPIAPPFHPDAAYPEYRHQATGPANEVYAALRELFRLLRLDSQNFGTARWNPLQTVVHPGDRVVLKPNFLWHAHKYDAAQWEQVITHGSVLRAVLDYVLIALDGRGEVWICDGPQLDANWDQIVERTGVGAVCEWCQANSSVPVRLLDLRDAWEDVRGEVLYKMTALPGDPAGGFEVDLGARSRFANHSGTGRYYGATYDQAETNYHHSEGRHQYRISKTVAAADVFINLPKMKTHKKVGVTLCLKNLVGINTGRNWLPHHTDGDPTNGGDQFAEPTLRNRSERWGIRRLESLTWRHPRLFAPLFRVAKAVARPFWGHTAETIRSGNWHGNDTCWRMVQDINRCLLYGDGAQFPTAQPKRFFAIVDGVVAGDGEGPAAPDRQETGVLVAGFNPVSVDCVTARLMGFDPRRIAMLREAFAPSDLPLAPFRYEDVSVASNLSPGESSIATIDPASTFRFQPHFSWRGHIEWQDSRPASPAAAPTQRT